MDQEEGSVRQAEQIDLGDIEAEQVSGDHEMEEDMDLISDEVVEAEDADMFSEEELSVEEISRRQKELVLSNILKMSDNRNCLKKSLRFQNLFKKVASS